MIVFDAAKIRPFEEKVLASGLCDFSLPAVFVNVDGIKSAVYDSSGYTCLDDIKTKGIDNILELIEKSLVNLDKAGEFLIDPKDMILDGSTVFQNLKKRDVKFAFVPSREQRPMNNIMALINYFEVRCTGDDLAVLSTLKRYIKARDLSSREAARHTAFVRRELKKRKAQFDKQP